jgi:hypothetical protein
VGANELNHDSIVRAVNDTDYQAIFVARDIEDHTTVTDKIRTAKHVSHILRRFPSCFADNRMPPLQRRFRLIVDHPEVTQCLFRYDLHVDYMFPQREQINNIVVKSFLSYINNSLFTIFRSIFLPIFADFSPKHPRISKNTPMNDDHFHSFVAAIGNLQANAVRAQQHVRDIAPVALSSQFERQLSDLLTTTDTILEVGKNGSA